MVLMVVVVMAVVEGVSITWGEMTHWYRSSGRLSVGSSQGTHEADTVRCFSRPRSKKYSAREGTGAIC